MKALVLGGDGMLGHKVFQVFSTDMETHATFLSHKEYDSALPILKDIPSSSIHLDINVLNDSAVENVIQKVKPDIVLNCIGLIKQLEKASDHVLSIKLNSLLPHKLAALCSEYNARLVHISTDCVFSGRKGNYKKDDPTDALDLYGKSKALGEVDYAPHLTLRTSIIGREWVRSTALLEWFLSQEGGTVRGYKNALYTGFTTETIAKLMKRTVLERSDITGLWQVSSNSITKLDLLTRIRDTWKLHISIEPYDDTPCDRSLNSERFFNKTGFERPSWDSMIDELVTDETPYKEWRKRNAELAIK